MDIISDRRWQRKWHYTIPIRPCDVPREPGVYAIYVDRVLVYIGQSSNLFHRLCSHDIDFSRYSNRVETPWGDGFSVQCKYRLSSKYGDWLMREARLIKRLQPSGNKRGNATWRATRAA
jgi:excinuclease UvrABC nuclease subunit